jgi:signal transduction histidine kinase
MGELASGVAHEIRNPLNTISTIVQQLNKDFEPKQNLEEYRLLANLVGKEINRINETIKDFLRFSKPEKIKLNSFLFSDLIKQIESQYTPMLSDKGIIFEINYSWDGQVNWDKNKILQVFMNLIQNSFDAIESNGKIQMMINKDGDELSIIINDNGSGIPSHLQNKIFNLYYTTKANGTGIGLSLVQRIVFEHNGTIKFISEENVGTELIIKLPINPTLD